MVARYSSISAALVIALALVPAAPSGTYADPSGDAGSAGDISGVVVDGVPATSLIVFRISGTNLATSVVNPLNLSIDSDSNPLTGDLKHHGTDYWFSVDDNSYWFARWNGSDWVDSAPSTVEVVGDTSQITISVHTQAIGGAAAFNFVAWTDVPGRGKDSAPNDGVSHYSLEAKGPGIDSVDVKTSPSSGPRAGKQFVIVPTGLRLEPDGSTTQTPVLPRAMPVLRSWGRAPSWAEGSDAAPSHCRRRTPAESASKSCSLSTTRGPRRRFHSCSGSDEARRALADHWRSSLTKARGGRA